MNINFPLVLLCLTVFSGFVALFDIIGRRVMKKRCSELPENTLLFPTIVEYARSFFPIFFIVLILRAFVAQPFKVPTGSLSPTVMPGDFIFVTQYNYGLKWPVWNKTVWPISHPKRGEIALFNYPVNQKVSFVKRVVGVPGDTISYIDKVLYINGKEQKQTYVRNAIDGTESGVGWLVKVYKENLDGVEHLIYRAPNRPAEDFYNLKIPEGEYLMMGDNRDNSADGRMWGLTPEADFTGRARRIWMNWTSSAPLFKKIAWSRIGKGLSDSPEDQ